MTVFEASFVSKLEIGLKGKMSFYNSASVGVIILTCSTSQQTVRQADRQTGLIVEAATVNRANLFAFIV